MSWARRSEHTSARTFSLFWACLRGMRIISLSWCSVAGCQNSRISWKQRLEMMDWTIVCFLNFELDKSHIGLSIVGFERLLISQDFSELQDFFEIKKKKIDRNTVCCPQSPGRRESGPGRENLGVVFGIKCRCGGRDGAICRPRPVGVSVVSVCRSRWGQMSAQIQPCCVHCLN